MPQAPDALRAEMKRLFGDPIDDNGPTQYLINAGYTDTSGLWHAKPGVKKLEDMEQDEWLCLLFLIKEWDHGQDISI